MSLTLDGFKLKNTVIISTILKDLSALNVMTFRVYKKK